VSQVGPHEYCQAESDLCRYIVEERTKRFRDIPHVGLNRLAVVEGASLGGLDFDWLSTASVVVHSRLVLFMLV
jgi:hypothetical protein